MKTKNIVNTDVVIVGAGLSGLYSAYLLKNFNYDVKIIEAKDRIGGRTYTINENGNSIDLGGQWISSKQTRVMNLVKSLGIEYFEQYDKGNHIMNFNNKVKLYQTDISNIESSNIINKLNELSNHLEKLEKFDEITAREWLESNCADKETKEMIDWLFKVCICVDSSNVSFYYWLNFIKSCGGYEQIANKKNGAQEYRVKGGAVKISEKLADKYNLEVKLNSPVIEINQLNGKCTVITLDTIYKCNQVIMTIPPQLNMKINYVPKLPDNKIKLYSNIKMGQVLKVVILYEKPWWREKGFSGEIISNNPPIFLSYDCSYEDKYYGLVCFICSDDIKSYSKASILNGFADYFDDSRALNPISYYEKNWTEEPYSEGCYFGVTNKNILSHYKHEFTKGYGNIFWAGTETANEWMGYMEGALESAERVVKQVDGLYKYVKSKL